MSFRVRVTTWAAMSLLFFSAAASAADTSDDAIASAVCKSAGQLATAINAGNADGATDMFLPQGELIDEEGTVYRGSQEIKDLLTAFFKKFPDTKLLLNIESVRIVGPVAIDEGTRTMTLKEGDVKSKFRYIAIWSKTDRGWKIASFRDFADDPAPTPHDQLNSIAWLVGDWVNEGTDGKVAISYRWSPDKNFLLGDFQYQTADGTPRKSTQRIGWDPSVGKIRSWLFDADGGFGEGCWTVVDDGIVSKSTSVNPDGGTASATITIKTSGKDRFTMAGTERIVGGGREPDFELTIVRRAPTPSK